MTAESLVACALCRSGKRWGCVFRLFGMLVGRRNPSGAIQPDAEREYRKRPSRNFPGQPARGNRSLRRALLALLWLPLAQHAVAQITIPAGASMTIPAGGSINLGCLDFNVQGIVDVGAGQISVANLSIAAVGILQGGSGTITVGGNWTNLGSFFAGSGTVFLTGVCATGSVQLTGHTIFNNLTLTSATGRTFVIPAGHGTTVRGVLTLQGVPGLPINVVSSSAQIAFIGLGGAAQLVSTNATVSSRVQIGYGVPLTPAVLYLLLD